MSNRDYRCPVCNRIQEVEVPLSQEGAHVHCEEDGALMRRYFGSIHTIPINYGFRSTRYLNSTDERIAQYQFEHL